jgi:ABC-type multidrug transport system ATPase subunit
MTLQKKHQQCLQRWTTFSCVLLLLLLLSLASSAKGGGIFSSSSVKSNRLSSSRGDALFRFTDVSLTVRNKNKKKTRGRNSSPPSPSLSSSSSDDSHEPSSWRQKRIQKKANKLRLAATAKAAAKAAKTKVILSNINGEVRRGELLAILGPSGSGKTSLISALADRIETRKGLKLSGKRKWWRTNTNTKAAKKQKNNDEDHSSAASSSAYVQQENQFFAHMTIRETLRFHAHLKLKTETSKMKDEAVEDLLIKFNLLKCADTIVGNVKVRGVSGGEKKRLAIALEMLGDDDEAKVS